MNPFFDYKVADWVNDFENTSITLQPYANSTKSWSIQTRHQLTRCPVHSSRNEKFKTIEPSLEHCTPLTLFPLLAFGNEWLINSWANVMDRTHRWRGLDVGDKWATLCVRWAFNQTKRPPCGLPSHQSAVFFPWIFPRENKITGIIFGKKGKKGSFQWMLVDGWRVSRGRKSRSRTTPVGIATQQIVIDR